MPRYVILWHQTPPGFPRGVHWDLMLEEAGHLRCWALSSSPDGAAPQAAEALADHRLAYLEYEGPISGDRGSVSRWDEGTYRQLDETGNGINKDSGELTLHFAGRRLNGRVVLSRQPGPDHCWRFSFSAE
ncbi:MAG: hypothetical protein K8T25_23335 [Planctomycetia bacterium]|nr:hypothetical protein [Planctomycetia bacterium]